jgi:AcrR family transcriptional regulator
MGQSRATTKLERAARRDRILSAAAELLESWSADDVNIDRIANRAGIAKGTVYLYFRTREELFLEVFSRHRDLWLDALEADFAGAGDELDPINVGHLFVASLIQRPLLVQLYSRVGALCNGNISPQALRRLRVRQSSRVTRVARTLHRHMPRVTVTQAARWISRMESCVAGFAQFAHPAHGAISCSEGLEVRELDVDFESELQYIAVTLLLNPWETPDDLLRPHDAHGIEREDS